MNGSGERHTSQGRARGQDHGTLDGSAGYDADHDWGSHQATNRREAMRGPSLGDLRRRLGNQYMIGAPLPCRLCQPGQRCAFHEDDAAPDAAQGG